MSRIKVYKENFADLLNDSASITVTDTAATSDGSAIIDYMRNRDLNSAWVTTGSSDSSLTELVIDIGGARDIDTIMLLGHNLKAYTIYEFDGSAYNLVHTATSDTGDTTSITISENTNKLKIIIQGTQVADADKVIRRLVITSFIGQFNGFPQVKTPTHETNKKITKLLSGKSNIIEAVGSFKVSLTFDNFTDTDDLQLVETIYMQRKGVNFLLSGGDEDQFTYPLRGYRNKDLYLMRPSDNYKPEWIKSIYVLGTKQTMKLIEVVR